MRTIIIIIIMVVITKAKATCWARCDAAAAPRSACIPAMAGIPSALARVCSCGKARRPIRRSAPFKCGAPADAERGNRRASRKPRAAHFAFCLFFIASSRRIKKKRAHQSAYHRQNENAVASSRVKRSSSDSESSNQSARRSINTFDPWTRWQGTMRTLRVLVNHARNVETNQLSTWWSV